MRPYISLTEYKEKSYMDRVKFWTEIIGNPELRLVGKVSRISETFCLIAHPQIALNDNSRLIDPFEYEGSIENVVGMQDISKELKKKEINNGDKVFFSLKIKKGEDFEEFTQRGKTPIVIKSGSVTKATDCEEYYINDLGMDKEVVWQTHLFRDFSSDSEQNIYYMSEDIKGLHSSLTIQVQQKRDELQVFEQKIAQIKKDYEIRHNHMKNELEQERAARMLDIEKELNEMEALGDDLKKYGFLVNDKEKCLGIKKKKEGRTFLNLEEMLKYLQSYLLSNEEKSLYYEISTLRNFYAGLRTEQLVILAGYPGTGKTSLAEGFAEAVNAEFRLIPVQPNWVDKTDLLGYYNPLEKNYISTPFLDAILEARENRDVLFFICLDEMNLACVEYYFAEFLSKLQTDRKIQLYSQTILDEVEDEQKARYRHFKNDIGDEMLEDYLQNADLISIERYVEIRKLFSMRANFPPILEIPRNVRFIGTINKDETTKDLSPKVIDRSFFVMVDSPGAKEREDALQQAKKQPTAERIPIQLRVEDLNPVSGDRQAKTNIQLQRAIQKLKPYKIQLTNRFDKAVNHLSGIGVLEAPVLMNIIATGLIFPRVNFDKYEMNLNDLKATLEAILDSKIDDSGKLLETMVQRDGEEQIVTITYWR